MHTQTQRAMRAYFGPRYRRLAREARKHAKAQTLRVLALGFNSNKPAHARTKLAARTMRAAYRAHIQFNAMF